VCCASNASFKYFFILTYYPKSLFRTVANPLPSTLSIYLNYENIVYAIVRGMFGRPCYRYSAGFASEKGETKCEYDGLLCGHGEAGCWVAGKMHLHNVVVQGAIWAVVL